LKELTEVVNSFKKIVKKKTGATHNVRVSDTESAKSVLQKRVTE
jgi:hypothetical protein